MRFFFALLGASALLVACNLNVPLSQSSTTLTPVFQDDPTDSPPPTQIATTQPSPVPPTSVPSATATLTVPETTNCTVRTDWQTYTVRAGDTLSAIAAASGIATGELATGNCLSDRNLITSGQQLRVPRQPVFPPTAAPTLTPTYVMTATFTPTWPPPTATRVLEPYTETWTFTSTIQTDTCGDAPDMGSFTATLIYSGDGRLYRLQTNSGDYPLRLAGTHPGYIGQITKEAGDIHIMDLFFATASARVILSVIPAGGENCSIVYEWSALRPTNP